MSMWFCFTFWHVKLCQSTLWILLNHPCQPHYLGEDVYDCVAAACCSWRVAELFAWKHWSWKCWAVWCMFLVWDPKATAFHTCRMMHLTHPFCQGAQASCRSLSKKCLGMWAFKGAKESVELPWPPKLGRISVIGHLCWTTIDSSFAFNVPDRDEKLIKPSGFFICDLDSSF